MTNWSSQHKKGHTQLQQRKTTCTNLINHISFDVSPSALEETIWVVATSVWMKSIWANNCLVSYWRFPYLLGMMAAIQENNKRRQEKRVIAETRRVISLFQICCQRVLLCYSFLIPSIHPLLHPSVRPSLSSIHPSIHLSVYPSSVRPFKADIIHYCL